MNEVAIPVKEQPRENRSPFNLVLLALQVVANLNLGAPSRKVLQREWVGRIRPKLGRDETLDARCNGRVDDLFLCWKAGPANSRHDGVLALESCD